MRERETEREREREKELWWKKNRISLFGFISKLASKWLAQLNRFEPDVAERAR
jgi:hypothetical protein